MAATKGKEKGDGVPELSAKSFETAISENKHVLVNFHAPWCGHCKELAPEYAVANVELSNASPPVSVYKMDAVAESRLAEKHGVQEYPTLLFFSAGSASGEEYLGPRDARSIVQWVSKRSGPALIPAGDKASTEKLMSGSNFSCLAFLPEGSPALEAVSKASLQVDDVVFVHVASPDVAAALGATPPVVQVRTPHDEKVFPFPGDLAGPAESLAAEIAHFAKDHRIPRIAPFDGDVSAELFDDGRPVLFLFRLQDEKGRAAEEALRKAAPTLRKKFLLSTVLGGVDPDAEEFDGRLAEFIGVRPDMLPLAVLAVDPLGPVKKYRQSGDVTQDSLLAMASGYDEGKLQPFVKSLPLPEESAGPVKELVGLTMKDAVLDEAKNVLVFMYAPWCGHCKKLAPVWEQLATAFASETSIVITKIDATANDLHGVEIETFPTIKLWAIGQKDKPLDYGEEHEKDLATLSKWLGDRTGVRLGAEKPPDPNENEL